MILTEWSLVLSNERSELLIPKDQLRVAALASDRFSQI